MKKIISKSLVVIVLTSLTSCSLTLPSFRRTNVDTDVTINNASAQLEPLKRSEYEVLASTTGSASTSQFYILFIPVGKTKSSAELYENAYYNAINNLPNADGLILPRKKNKKLIIPLILVNYCRKEIEVSGVGIAVKGKQPVELKK
jgi:hypothetical protein